MKLKRMFGVRNTKNSQFAFLKKGIVLLCLMFSLSSCEDIHFGSSIPSAPVQLRIDTRQGNFTKFVSTNIYTYVIANRNGYYYFTNTHPDIPRTMSDYCGFAGVVVYIGGDGRYTSYDLGCPKCRRKDTPLNVDGFFAICPICSEAYDLSNGLGIPTKGIVKEPLKRYSTIISDAIIHVRN